MIGFQPKTILILYLSVGSGHRRAALALQTALRERDPISRVICLDIFEAWPPWIGRSVRRLYLWFIKIAPRAWTYLYDNQAVKRILEGPLRVLEGICRGKVGWLLEEFSPTTVVCTQAFPARLLASLKERRLSIPLVAVPTDYRVHAYWLDERINLYLVPSEEAARRLQGEGVPRERLRVTGIPVHISFESHYFPHDLRRKYGLLPDFPTVLLMSGGEGTVKLKEMITALDNNPGDFQLVALSGRNLKLRARLQRLQPHLRHRLVALSFTDRVDELMEAADILVTKPGGLTTAEALVKGLPMVLLSPLPGQEELNARYLESRSAALVVTGPGPAAAAVGKLLESPEILDRMSKTAQKLAFPRSAREAARLILMETDV